MKHVSHLLFGIYLRTFSEIFSWTNTLIRSGEWQRNNMENYVSALKHMQMYFMEPILWEKRANKPLTEKPLTLPWTFSLTLPKERKEKNQPKPIRNQKTPGNRVHYSFTWKTASQKTDCCNQKPPKLKKPQLYQNQDTQKKLFQDSSVFPCSVN